MPGPTASTHVHPWSRRRLLATLMGVLAAVLALTVGLGLSVYYAVTGEQSTRTGAARAPASHADATGRQRRDQIAARPMLHVPREAATSGTPSATPAETITLPDATTTGPAGVPTGFPQTPQGAVAQLAAIEIDVMQGMSIPHTNEVHQRWALPGAVGVATWPLTRNVQAFLAHAGQGQAKDTTITVTTEPVAAQIKGTDGNGWVLACVLLDVRAAITTQARMAYGYCERMQWSQGRWMIAPGDSPATAPSTWPGTDLAREAGWRLWVEQQ